MPGEKATELQAYNLQQIQDAGGIAATVHSPEEAIAIVWEIVQNAVAS